MPIGGLGSLLREIDSLAPKKHEDKVRQLRARGENAFASVRRLIELIEDACDEEEAEDMVKRFLSSAKSGSFRKFELGLKKIGTKGKATDDKETE